MCSRKGSIPRSTTEQRVGYDKNTPGKPGLPERVKRGAIAAFSHSVRVGVGPFRGWSARQTGNWDEREVDHRWGVERPTIIRSEAKDWPI